MMVLLALAACVPDDVYPIPPAGWSSPSAACADGAGAAVLDVAFDGNGGFYSATFVGTPPDGGPRVVAVLPAAGYQAWAGSVALDVATCAKLEGWGFTVALVGRGDEVPEAVCPENVPGCG